jgi:hypothetical protein
VLATGLRLTGPADRGDLASFLGRAVALDPAAVTRLRTTRGRVTAYVRLPFGVLVSRTVSAAAEPVDVTVGAADLLASLDPGPSEPASPGVGEPVGWPRPRDVEWRAALPPATGWLRLDSVPGDVVRALVRAGRDALRAVPAGAVATAGESLLDHESLTVSGGGQTAVLPLRVLSALTRMGFLGGDLAADVVVVSAAGGSWHRLAGAYGSAYQHIAPGLSLR